MSVRESAKLTKQIYKEQEIQTLAPQKQQNKEETERNNEYTK